ncbi:hypothetical protein AAH476_16615, partial [Enterobacter cloacae subsp. cloacae]|nr:hypothetical protein [Enterobacter cloacae]
GTVCVVGKMRDLILQLSKSSIYSTKPFTDEKRTYEYSLGFIECDSLRMVLIDQIDLMLTAGM